MSVCDIPVISAVCETAGEAAATLVSAPFDWLASTMGQAAGWLLETMWQVFDSTTLVDVTSDGYLGVYNLLFGIGVFVVLLFFTFQLVLGLIRREPAALSRAALGAAKAILGSFVVITLTGTGTSTRISCAREGTRERPSAPGRRCSSKMLSGSSRSTTR